jgi:hypothetical protein
MSTASIRKFAGQFGPLMLVELILPGGTLIAAILYLLQRYRQSRLAARKEAVNCEACA